MLAKLDIKLDSGENLLSYLMSSSFHGALMKMLPGDYADELHESALHPYTQHLEEDNEGGWHWVITALNQETTEKLIQENVMREKEIYLDKHDFSVQLLEKKYTEVSEDALDRYFYRKEAERSLTIRFLTPTAFKQRKRYVNYPDLRLIYGSLLKKYAAARQEEMAEELLEQLVSATSISRYSLHSTWFSLENVQVPAFAGSMTLRLDGTPMQANLAQLLFFFGSYSGIGIKASIGMGAIAVGKTDKRKIVK